MRRTKLKSGMRRVAMLQSCSSEGSIFAADPAVDADQMLT